MSSKYRLYGRQGSGSLAVQVALEEAGVEYENHWISKDPAEVDRYRAINASGKVPALVLPDGTTMIESAAMLIHLALEYPKSGLAPQPDDAAHALFLQWMVYLSANVYESALRMYYPARYSSRGEQDAEAIKQQAAKDFETHMAHLAASLNPYVLGSTYSIADVYLYMLAGWHLEGSSGLFKKLPRLKAQADLIAKRPAVMKVERQHNA